MIELRVGLQLRGRALGDHRAAVRAGRGPDLDDPVRGADDLPLVLHHDHRIAVPGQGRERLAQPGDVARVQPDRRLAAPCGKVLRLDDAAVIKRLDLDSRLTQLVSDAGFTDEELKEVKSSIALLKEQAFEGYRSAFSTWYQPTDDIQATLDQFVTGTMQSEKYQKLPTRKRELNDGYLLKFEKMMVTAHNLGKRDGTTAPCPF